MPRIFTVYVSNGNREDGALMLNDKVIVVGAIEDAALKVRSALGGDVPIERVVIPPGVVKWIWDEVGVEAYVVKHHIEPYKLKPGEEPDDEAMLDEPATPKPKRRSPAPGRRKATHKKDD